MNLPPFVYSLAFWKAFSYAVGGLLAALAALGKIPPEWALTGAAILSAVLTVLSWVGIEPELRAKALLREQKLLIAELEQAKREFYSAQTPTKKSRK